MKMEWVGHEFNVYTMDGGAWKDHGGVYVFAGRDSSGQWRAYYVGQTRSFAKRFPSHEKWDLATRYGATHVHTRRIASASLRSAIERQIILSEDPPLNAD